MTAKLRKIEQKRVTLHVHLIVFSDMPYIRIKAYPKDQATKEKVVEAINKAFVDNWGCPPQAISISIEEVAPENWVETVEKAEIEPNADKMFVLNGEKKY